MMSPDRRWALALVIPSLAFFFGYGRLLLSASTREAWGDAALVFVAMLAAVGVLVFVCSRKT